MPYSTNRIITINADLYNFLNDVNYGMSKPQFHHLSTIVNGLVNLSGTKSLAKISKHILEAKHSSSIYKFLSRSQWDDSLIDANRINYLNFYFENAIKPGSIGFLALDDTVNPKEAAKKMDGLAYNYSHTENKNVWSHCVVTSNFVCGDISTQLQFQTYLNKEQCDKFNKPFKGKPDIAVEFISNFQKPSNCDKLYCLMDSWYTGQKPIEAALSKGYHVIGALKSNRKISPLGITMQLKEFAKYIDSSTLDVVTVRGKEYRYHLYEGPVSNFENALVLICYERDGDNFKAPMYLLSTDVELNAETVISYYQNRWNIETNYKYLKSNLGFDEYKVRSILSIERYFLLVFLTLNFLEIYRLQILSSEATLGDALRELSGNSFQALVYYIYSQAKEDVPIKKLLVKLKLAA